MKNETENNNKSKRAKGAPTRKGLDTIRLDALKTDPLGSYTGRPRETKSVPVQDADDL